MTSYVNPFTGQTVSPSQVGYESLSITADTTLQWPVNGNTADIVANIIDVTASTNGLALIFPSAEQVSVGQAVLIRNTSTTGVNVIIKNASGGTIVSAAPSVAYYIYLTSNATAAGTWTTITFGAGTSAANASDLAGYGLVAIGATLNQQYLVQQYYSSTTLTSTARAQMNVWLSGVGTFTLPSAAAVGANWFTIFKNDGTGILTLTPAGADTIDGNANQQLQLTESLVLVSSGSTWYTYAYGRSNSFAYTLLALSVTGGTYTLTSAQAANTIQIYTGALTSNEIIVVPSTVQLYTVTNNTTGAYTLTVKTAVVGGATVTIPQGASLVIICDGTNVYNAASGSSSSLTSLTLGNGSLAVPSLKFSGDLNSGVYLPATGQVGFVIANTQRGYYNATGLTIAGTGVFSNGIQGGGF